MTNGVKTLTPSSDLRKALHGEAIDFSHFRQQYREELETHRDEGLRLAKLANQQPLTLLYAAKDTQQKPCAGAGGVAEKA